MNSVADQNQWIGHFKLPDVWIISQYSCLQHHVCLKGKSQVPTLFSINHLMAVGAAGMNWIWKIYASANKQAWPCTPRLHKGGRAGWLISRDFPPKYRSMKQCPCRYSGKLRWWKSAHYTSIHSGRHTRYRCTHIHTSVGFYKYFVKN